MIIDKSKILLRAFIASIVVVVIAIGVSSLIISKAPEQPIDRMIRHELVIHNTGEFSELYVDEINLDRGNQPFGLSAEIKSNDLHLYVLAHKTSEQDVKEYVEWIINYYGAEEIKQ